MKILIMLSVIFTLSACSSSPDNQLTFDDSLYSGKPVETLSNDETLPKTEIEAIKRGDKALQANNIDLALYEYIRSLSFLDAQYKDKTLNNIGSIHQARGNNALAEYAYKKSIEENPNNVQSLEKLGILYCRTGNVEEGKSYLYRAINADQVRLNQSQQLSEKNISSDAILDLKYDKQSPLKSYNALGVMNDMNEKFAVARAFYQKALQINPNDISANLNLGYSFYMSKDYDKALSYTGLVVRKQPDNKKAVNNLALIYIRKGQVNRALNIFMKQMPDYEALNNVGYFLLIEGRPDQAVPYFNQAIEKKPSYYQLANDNLTRALSEIRMKKI